jgi:hypothetical protein
MPFAPWAVAALDSRARAARLIGAAMLMAAKVAQVAASAALPTTLVRLVNAAFNKVVSAPRAATAALDSNAMRPVNVRARLALENATTAHPTHHNAVMDSSARRNISTVFFVSPVMILTVCQDMDIWLAQTVISAAVTRFASKVLTGNFATIFKVRVL